MERGCGRIIKQWHVGLDHLLCWFCVHLWFKWRGKENLSCEAIELNAKDRVSMPEALSFSTNGEETSACTYELIWFEHREINVGSLWRKDRRWWCSEFSPRGVIVGSLLLAEQLEYKAHGSILHLSNILRYFMMILLHLGLALPLEQCSPFLLSLLSGPQHRWSSLIK